MPKAVWVILILLFGGFAAIAWFIFGRPRQGVEGTSNTAGSIFRGLGPQGGGGFTRPSSPRPDPGAQTGWQLGGTGGRRRSGPIAPDDDPDFLRQLGRRRPDDSGEPKPGA